MATLDILWTTLGLCFRMFQIGWVDIPDYKLVKGWLVVAVGGLWHGGLLLYNALVY